MSGSFSRSAVLEARKTHSCDECGQRIKVGDKYERIEGRDDESDGFYVTKLCLRCSRLWACFWKRRRHLYHDEDLGIGSLRETIRDGRPREVLWACRTRWEKAAGVPS